ncbi:MAG TPA: hypothetical protein DCS93_34745 [Microscillaceae bacterium]|nr:hypothetical protein [Microscillaceae bacterium]
MKAKHFLWTILSLLFVAAIVYLVEQHIVYRKSDLRLVYGFLSKKPIIKNSRFTIHVSVNGSNRQFITDRAGFRALQKQKIIKELSKGDFVTIGKSKAFIRNHKNDVLLYLSSDSSTYISLEAYNQERRRTFRFIFYFIGGIMIAYLLARLIKQHL